MFWSRATLNRDKACLVCYLLTAARGKSHRSLCVIDVALNDVGVCSEAFLSVFCRTVLSGLAPISSKQSADSGSHNQKRM